MTAIVDDMNDVLATLALNMRRAALLAATQTMRFFRKEDLDVAQKADASPVTEGDLAAHHAIVAELSATHPDVPIISEEGALGPAPEAPYFLVDPLDGTKEFSSGRGEFTVNIAYVEMGAPVLGVVAAPAVERLFWTPERGRAVEEHGARALDVVGRLTELRASPADPDRLRIVATKSHMNEATSAFLARYPDAELKSAGSALKFCLLAAQEADLYPRLGPTMEWDTAAAQAVLEAAGGSVETFDGERLRYSKPGWRNPHFLARADATGEL
ncbi:MAG: 3'(2'),5'-bisphosphate nucleotidase CysQ [Pseudomonadota bacterium]